MTLSIEFVNSMQEVGEVAWNRLVGDMPLLSHAFLSALETSGSVGLNSGWQPCHMLLQEGDVLVAAMPLYFKQHSYGEYVFDWAWADAYERAGVDYYPKLLSAIPFTPITSERLLTAESRFQRLLIDALENIMRSQNLSSVHVNFPANHSAQALSDAGWLQRKGVQFRWENQHFGSFDDFLMTLSHDKRKKIRQERKKVLASNVVCRRIKGVDITEQEWQFFYECYVNTYIEHRSTPYLTSAFFAEISQKMPENILLILAYIDDVPIASAFNIYHQTTLYGRYWGALRYVPNLHFELCYYQAQEFCIEHTIQFFEGGAQGEHKLARGFKPRETCSFHKIADADFASAIGQFVARESLGIAAYTNELEERAPFKTRG